jgi:hypothetical protein
MIQNYYPNSNYLGCKIDILMGGFGQELLSLWMKTDFGER